MSATSSGLKSKLRETLKQEDAALAERSRAVAKPAAAQPRVGKPDAAEPAATATPTTAAQALQPTVGGSAAAEKRATATLLELAAPAAAGCRDKGEKVERDSFSMPVREHKRIKALREALGEHGVLVSKSALLRAGLALLAERDTGEIARLVAALPKVAKGKRKRR